MAIVQDCYGGRIYAEQRNKFNKGDEVEVLSPDGEPVTLTVEEMFDEHGNEIETANHATMKLSIKSDLKFARNSIIRIASKKNKSIK